VGTNSTVTQKTGNHNHMLMVTLIPANLPALPAMIAAGANCVRINADYFPDFRDLASAIDQVRFFAGVLHKQVMVAIDLGGEKMRVENVPEGSLVLKVNDHFVLTSNRARTDEKLPVVQLPYPDLFPKLAPGVKVRIDDGTIEGTVFSAQADECVIQISVGDTLRNRKGVAFEGIENYEPALTMKDKRVLDFLASLEHQPDLILLSFVKSPADMIELRDYVRGHRLGLPMPKLWAKLETSKGVERAREIARVSDGLLLGRGDLLQYVDRFTLPRLQRFVIESARIAGCPLVIGTGVLASMTESPFPARSELDAIDLMMRSGVSGLLLSTETSRGKYPAQAVAAAKKMMAIVEEEMVARASRKGKHVCIKRRTARKSIRNPE
jgi:pyruvate kinase